MRPRVTKVQKVSQGEIENNEGIRPRRSKDSSTNTSSMYTWVFGRKVYITKDEIEKFNGFTIIHD